MKAAASRRSAVHFPPISLPRPLAAAHPVLDTLDVRGAEALGARRVPRVIDDGGPFAVARGGAGDHPSILQFLATVFPRPSATEFQARNDAPAYRPQDRLLVRRAGDVIAHVGLARREVRFGPHRLAASDLYDFAVRPECRNCGCGSALLRAAEERLRDEGLVWATLRTRAPQFFLKRGWCVGSRHSYSVARASEILSHLRQRRAPRCHALHPAAPPLNIRLWRHVELAALTRLYAANTTAGFGPLVRGDDYWRWLIDRRGYERIYVAIDGPDKLDLDESLAPIVGYAVMRQERIMEIMTARGDERAVEALLQRRACGDAMERDVHHLRVDAPPDDPVHQHLVAANGSHHVHEADGGEVLLAKILDPAAFLRQIGELLLQRVRDAGLPLPCELGLQVGRDRYSLSLGPRALRLNEGRLGRSHIACGRAAFSQLVLGHLDPAAALQSGRVAASTRIAQELAAAVFPQLPLWHTPWDDQRAC